MQPSYRSRAALFTLAATSILLSPFHKPALADSLPTAPIVPTLTKVLLLPTIDESGDKPEMVRAHVLTGNHRAEYEFLTRGFQMLSPDVAMRAAHTEDIDLDDAESRGKRDLKALGRDTGADWVVSLAVIEVREEKVSNFWTAAVGGNQRRAKAKVQVRILDVKNDLYISNQFCQDTKTSQRFLGNIGTTGLFKQAIDVTIQRSLINILTPYPQVKKIADEFGEDDLLTSAYIAVPAGNMKPASAVDSPSQVKDAVTK